VPRIIYADVLDGDTLDIELSNGHIILFLPRFSIRGFLVIRKRMGSACIGWMGRGIRSMI